MTKLTIEIVLDNDAFLVDRNTEIRRCLVQVQQQIEMTNMPQGTLRDSNGNTVGAWRIKRSLSNPKPQARKGQPRIDNTEPSERDRTDFEAYLDNASDAQVRGILAKEEAAGRVHYARMARLEAARRGLRI